MEKKKFSRIFPKAKRLTEKIFLNLFTSQTFRKRKEELDFWKSQLNSKEKETYWQDQYFQGMLSNSRLNYL